MNCRRKKPADSDLLSAGFPLRQKTSAPDGAEVFASVYKTELLEFDRSADFLELLLELLGLVLGDLLLDGAGDALDLRLG